MSAAGGGIDRSHRLLPGPAGAEDRLRGPLDRVLRGLQSPGAYSNFSSNPNLVEMGTTSLDTGEYGALTFPRGGKVL